MKIIENASRALTNFVKLDISKKEFFSSISLLFIIYFLAIISILRANFHYVDDLRRNIDGYGLDGVFSRHISKYLSHIIHADSHIADVSPLPQLVACLILALTGFIVVKTICNKSNKLLLIASLPIGLSPYFLECFSYKFDSPYMALSILAGVFPFLFMQKNRWLYALICILSTLIMTMTYQAASGVFIMMTLFIFFTNLNLKKTTIKDNLIFLAISLASYCAAILIFKLFLMKPIDFGYVSTSVADLKNIVAVFSKNLKIYWRNIHYDLNVIWKVLMYAIVAIYYIKTIFLSKQNKILAFFLTSIFLVLMFLSSFGLYLILEQPLRMPRAMYGVGFFIALLSIDICFSLKKIFAIFPIALIWCFFVFNFAYGNALADQKRYAVFRTELLLQDLSSLFPEKPDKPYPIRIINSIGYSPVVENLAKNNPITGKIVPINLKGKWSWGYCYLTRYHKFKLIMNDDLIADEMPVIFDSYYHTIKSSDNQIVVILK